MKRTVTGVVSTIMAGWGLIVRCRSKDPDECRNNHIDDPHGDSGDEFNPETLLYNFDGRKVRITIETVR